MNRLVKAEWFRVRKSSGIMKWLIIICLLILVIPFLDDVSSGKITATSYFMAFEEQACMFIPLFLSALAGAFAGMSFNNKTALYEVMAGNKTWNIINSKLLVIVPLISLLFSGLFAALLGIFGIVNGTGELKQLPLRMLLLFIIVLHVVVVAVLAVTSVRHILGIGIGFLRFAMLEEILVIWIQIAAENASMELETVQKMSSWFVQNQIMSLNMETIPTYFVVRVILSLVIEAAVWYVISYIGYKRKKFQ
ncbi:MAG: hypothetical protein J6L77_10365 [Coprococcus sp.]|nr:hypothetical protein [Coprococcus sp.]